MNKSIPEEGSFECGCWSSSLCCSSCSRFGGGLLSWSEWNTSALVGCWLARCLLAPPLPWPLPSLFGGPVILPRPLLPPYPPLLRGPVIPSRHLFLCQPPLPPTPTPVPVEVLTFVELVDELKAPAPLPG